MHTEEKKLPVEDQMKPDIALTLVVKIMGMFLLFF